MIYSYKGTPFGQLMPLLPVQFKKGKKFITEDALVDSGSSLNVIPYSLGRKLGLSWDSLKLGPNLSGNADGETRVIELLVKIPDLADIKLGFAWTSHDRVRFILGQDDFFKNFHVCFLRDRGVFSIKQIEVAS